MSYYEMQFIHKPLVQVKICSISGSLYPMLDALMSAAKREHGFHVSNNNLLAINLTPRQVLHAFGQQTGQGTVVGGKISGFLRYFNNHWHNFQNLTILSWHNSAGTILITRLLQRPIHQSCCQCKTVYLPIAGNKMYGSSEIKCQSITLIVFLVSLHFASTSTSSYLKSLLP